MKIDVFLFIVQWSVQLTIGHHWFYFLISNGGVTALQKLLILQFSYDSGKGVTSFTVWNATLSQLLEKYLWPLLLIWIDFNLKMYK